MEGLIMEILEFGNKNKPKIILVHGFQSPYQVWNKYIEYFKNDFHILVPILTGHNPGQPENFVSFFDDAKEIEDYYIHHYGNNLYAIFGMSMGGVLSAILWQNKKLNINKVIFDGSPLVSYNNLIKKMFVKFYTNITHKAQQRDKKTIKRAVNSIISEKNLEDFLSVLDVMSDTTIVNCITSVGEYKLPSDIDTPETKIYYYYGTALNEIFSRKTAKFLLKNYSNSNIKCFKRRGHCENSLIYPEIMIKELDEVLI